MSCQSRKRLRARLTSVGDGAGASGNAKWESRDDRQKFSVEGEDLPDVLSGEDAVVFVDGEEVGSAEIDDGEFDLNLDSRRGDDIPDADVDSVVNVKVNDVDVLTGVLKPK